MSMLITHDLSVDAETDRKVGLDSFVGRRDSPAKLFTSHRFWIDDIPGRNLKHSFFFAEFRWIVNEAAIKVARRTMPP